MKPEIEENPVFIVIAIILLYMLIIGFVGYFYYMGKMSMTLCLTVCTIFTAIYLPRFIIIWKIYKKDLIKITDNNLLINNLQILLSNIINFAIKKEKPVVIFFMNNKMIVYNEAIFTLKIKSNEAFTYFEFKAIGSEKIELLKSFLNEITSKNL